MRLKAKVLAVAVAVARAGLAACGGGGGSGASAGSSSAIGNPAPAPPSSGSSILSGSEAVLGFYAQAAGTTSAAQILTLTNSSTSAVDSLTGITIGGASAAEFVQANACAGSLAPGQSCAVSVVYTPVVPSETSAAVLTVRDSVTGEALSVQLAGTSASAPSGCTPTASQALALAVPQAPMDRRELQRRLADITARPQYRVRASSPAAASGFSPPYAPADIRTAYNLPPLPASYAGLSAAQLAALGAGQTIYVVDAHSYSAVVGDLAAFSQAFGLPACTSASVPAATVLPLPGPGAGSCSLEIAYATAGGTLTDTAPTYDASWAPEIALDVQWAHATAPLARIVLVLAPDASTNSLVGAIDLVNKMGAGVVSMSFAAPEGSWVLALDPSFKSPGMSYVAASGDTGAGVNWPAVSPNVLAVGGTSLAMTQGSSGAGAGGSYAARASESVWSGTGGGVSAFEPLPDYQRIEAVPGEPSASCASDYRADNDVSFNADPATGQYVYLTLPGSSGALLAYGGTSIAAPQWAGLLAIANAQRALAGKAAVGDAHTALYNYVAAENLYAVDYFDIVTGADGTCASCFAAAGFDLPSGLGTPNASSLLDAIAAK